MKKRRQSVALGLIRCCKRVGIPNFLQVNNELCFREGNHYPRSFSIVLRVYLLFGIEVVFIPIGEPLPNGIVESLNDTYNRRF